MAEWLSAWLLSRDMAEISLKRRKSSIQPTNQPTITKAAKSHNGFRQKRYIYIDKSKQTIEKGLNIADATHRWSNLSSKEWFLKPICRSQDARRSCGQRTRPDHNLTIYDETKFSSCHTPYINSFLHPASSYYFLSHKKLFQTGNFNVNVRPDLLYFSIWGVY